MGSKKSKPGHPDVPQATLPKKVQITEKDYKFLTAQTGLSKNEIKEVFDQFMANNPDGVLDRKEFVRLYDQLRPEPPEILDQISLYVFKSFDGDRNGSISFNEFLVAYALTSRGDNKKKLEYAFNLYDANSDGVMDVNEVKAVLFAMLDMLGADQKNHDIQVLTTECVKDLDVSQDGKISKAEFIDGLLKNYSLRELMSPFN